MAQIVRTGGSEPVVHFDEAALDLYAGTLPAPVRRERDLAPTGDEEFSDGRELLLPGPEEPSNVRVTLSNPFAGAEVSTRSP